MTDPKPTVLVHGAFASILEAVDGAHGALEAGSGIETRRVTR
ncbi:hypothetical protein ACVCAH_20120 [Micromonospora sp. LZ34]